MTQQDFDDAWVFDESTASLRTRSRPKRSENKERRSSDEPTRRLLQPFAKSTIAYSWWYRRPGTTTARDQLRSMRTKASSVLSTIPTNTQTRSFRSAGGTGWHGHET